MAARWPRSPIMSRAASESFHLRWIAIATQVRKTDGTTAPAPDSYQAVAPDLLAPRGRVLDPARRDHMRRPALSAWRARFVNSTLKMVLAAVAVVLSAAPAVRRRSLRHRRSLRRPSAPVASSPSAAVASSSEASLLVGTQLQSASHTPDGCRDRCQRSRPAAHGGPSGGLAAVHVGRGARHVAPAGRHGLRCQYRRRHLRGPMRA